MKGIKPEEIIKAGLALIIIGIVVIGLVYACSYRKIERVTVVDRWWSYFMAVRWDETECSALPDADGNIEVSCDTDTYTRCKTTETGRDLPPQRPEIPCRMRSGDYLRENVSYTIKYRIQETKDVKRARFGRDQWDGLAPGFWLNLTTDIMGNVKEIDRSK